MKPRTYLFFIAVALLSGCSSSVTKPSVTTIDPQIAALQQQLEELQTQVNATTIPTTTILKAAVKIVEIMRYADGNTKGQGSQSMHQCREIIKYSDGTEVESSRWWAQTGQNSIGVYSVKNC